MIRGLVYGLCLAVLWVGGASACIIYAGEQGEVVLPGPFSIEHLAEEEREQGIVEYTWEPSVQYHIHCDDPVSVETPVIVTIDGHEVYRMTREELALACKVLKMEREGGE